MLAAAIISSADGLLCLCGCERPDIQADYVIVAQTLLHIKNVDSILSRLYDVLDKNGHLFVIDFDKNEDIISDEVHNGFEQEELIEAAKDQASQKREHVAFIQGDLPRQFINATAQRFFNPLP